jgi:hypothetical protein
MSHKFKLKQSVALSQSSALSQGRREVYEIVRLMPETVSGEPQYRLRSIATGTERVVRESELRSL